MGIQNATIDELWTHAEADDSKRKVHNKTHKIHDTEKYGSKNEE